MPEKTPSDSIRLANLLDQEICKAVGQPRDLKKDLGPWVKDLAPLLKRYQWEELKESIKWAFRQSNFWATRIYVPKNLINSIDKIVTQYRREIKIAQRTTTDAAPKTGTLPRLCPHPFHLPSWRCPVCIRTAGFEAKSPDEIEKIWDTIWLKAKH